MLSSQSSPSSSPSPVFSSLCVPSASAFSSLSRFCIGKSSAPRFSQTRPLHLPSSGSFCGSFPNLQTFQHANLPTFPRRLFSPKLFRIRIFENYAHNSRRIRTFKTQDLKPFRICIYKKTPRGVPLTDFFPSETSWARRAGNRRWLPTRDTAPARARAPSLWSVSKC